MRTREKSLPEFGVERRGTIVIADQDGFTKTILERGTKAALEDIWTIRKLLIPVFRHRGGEVYKIEADNLYVFFHQSDAAVAASLEAHATLETHNRKHSARAPLSVGIGIGCGPLVYLPGEEDYFGPEVNLASKLGEDLADGGETLLTRGAEASLTAEAPGRAGRLRRVTISGVRLGYREWFAD